jgi:hypothetical protein
MVQAPFVVDSSRNCGIDLANDNFLVGNFVLKRAGIPLPLAETIRLKAVTTNPDSLKAKYYFVEAFLGYCTI